MDPAIILGTAESSKKYNFNTERQGANCRLEIVDVMTPTMQRKRYMDAFIYRFSVSSKKILIKRELKARGTRRLTIKSATVYLFRMILVFFYCICSLIMELFFYRYALRTWYYSWISSRLLLEGKDKDDWKLSLLFYPWDLIMTDIG